MPDHPSKSADGKKGAIGNPVAFENSADNDPAQRQDGENRQAFKH
jgi:hypothetical protein